MSDNNIIPFADPNRDLVRDKLCQAHEAEAEKRGTEFWNYGCGSAEHRIESKTDKAKLYSTINPTTLVVTHEWEPYWYQPIGDSPSERRILKEYLKTDMETENRRRREFAKESARFVESLSGRGAV